jgi:predicted PurR-regulated permease PerM
VTTVLLVALAACFAITAFEEFVRPIGRFRGFVALILSLSNLLVSKDSVASSAISILASAFLTLVILSFMDKSFGTIPESMARRLPRRVPPL